MPALYIMIPVALVLVVLAIYVFFWAVDSGQYDDLDGPAHSILFDEQAPDHQSAPRNLTTEPKRLQHEEKPDA
ncbi:cbb3-type cytochrome oxidase assembly protein CcoS [Pseudomonas sp. CDFA 602]|uniref:cbb3-type cytochrome oxidase assembly protein CcoS n=1 Tax=Pseudomonas californiensis TaxID=2829823 RepID=UPI001E31A6C0|nr:cbb3-type cytochrome oxidase assembly protein CcoS [Pseudomonas californiensis]MCD5993038.1 cbb3-type cytochrome oxidase assembly protein CcoS [Pseudomonas californiensis]MCD5998415.1 cbb3-type cytochrome oxidase assembly protein CcoS [Pseudomonas californiensis]